MSKLSIDLPILDCTRCGDDHMVKFSRLTTPIGNFISWGMCPTTQEPILAILREDLDGALTDGDQDIIRKLLDLQRQATTERSHYYVAACVTEAIQEILTLRMKVK